MRDATRGSDEPADGSPVWDSDHVIDSAWKGHRRTYDPVDGVDHPRRAVRADGEEEGWLYVVRDEG